jgi:HEAT repeat protein
LSLANVVPGMSLDDWRVWALLISIALLLAAAAVFLFSASTLRYRNIRKLRQWQDLERRWESRLAEWLSGGEDVASLYNEVEPGEELYFLDFLYKRARGIDSERRARLAEAARPYLPVIAARIGTGDAERRARAVQTVSVLGFSEHADRILTALDDPSPLVSMVAARTLARARRQAYAEAIFERIHRYEDWSPKFLTSMLVSMGEVAGGFLRDTLASVLHTDRIRAVCADALCEMQDGAAAETAAVVLAQKPDAEVVAACLRLLARVGSRQHVPIIRPFVESDHVGVRAQAITALGRLGGNFESALLRQALEDPSAWVALHAARALRDRGHSHYLRALAAARERHTATFLQVLTE